MALALAYRNYTLNGSLRETKGGQYCVTSVIILSDFFLIAIHQVYFRVVKEEYRRGNGEQTEI